MIIGHPQLSELVRAKKLVENLSERELTNPEGTGFDLRLGEIYKITGGTAFLGVTERQTPQIELVAAYSERKNSTFIVPQNEYFLIKTIETINLPLNITANFKPRSTTYRMGLFIRTGNAAPGYSGGLTFGMKNEGPLPVTLELGCRIANVLFYWIDGEGKQYRGQWMGGRVTTDKREVQV